MRGKLLAHTESGLLKPCMNLARSGPFAREDWGVSLTIRIGGSRRRTPGNVNAATGVSLGGGVLARAEHVHGSNKLEEDIKYNAES